MKNTLEHTKLFSKQLICVHDAEDDFKNFVFKIIGYVKYEFKFFLVLKFLTDMGLVGWSVFDAFGQCRLVIGRWSVVLGRISVCNIILSVLISFEMS